MAESKGFVVLIRKKGVAKEGGEWKAVNLLYQMRWETLAFAQSFAYLKDELDSAASVCWMVIAMGTRKD